MKTDGFIALMSAIIIAAVLLVVIIGGSLIGFYSRFNVLDAEAKERSVALAEACIEDIRLQLAQNNGVATAREVTVDAADPTAKCEIRQATSPYQVRAHANGAFTNIEVLINNDLTVTSWKEVAEF